MESRENRFESLSILASREEWCWNLFCTTCGHMVFRYGLKALARGLNPKALDWPVHWGAERGWSRALEGPHPPAGGWPLEEQEEIQKAACGCSLERIAREVAHRDWLGHLGVLLRYTEDAEKQNLLLTRELVPQLVKFVGERTPADRLLQNCLENNEPLQWGNLDTVERHFRQPAPPTQGVR